MKDNAITLSAIGLITLIGNWIGFGIKPLEALPGMAILVAIAILGWWISKVIPVKIESPTVVWISLLALLLTSPIFPGHEILTKVTNKVNFMALTTPVLSYAGLSLGKDINTFKKLGFRIVVISLLVYTGTFLFATGFAQIVLKLNGTI
ncbi:hypothetical protein [Clostridium thailandense]|uniref:DUF340 domain-containing protein n=1 Tax=Clostridium thailandense TaxID=2794346 RepID=A0A949TWX4_9CLOT|nr:hypothetical protein [Clostridium thailandense]MBV7274028.1 hypothetical protein [Clostridium thailandense]